MKQLRILFDRPTSGIVTDGKAISIRQPWAWMIINRYKDIENRTWKSNYRGRILIHASKTIDRQGVELMREIFENENEYFPSEFDTGGIIGSVLIKDCVTSHKSPWFTGPYGFVLAKPRELPFYPVRGRLGIWTFTRDQE